MKRNTKVLYQLMFQVSASVMKDFGQQQKKGEIGFTSVLHTQAIRSIYLINKP
ncbi:MAG: hypothetical protein HRU24_10065 [Gammaproteobacteria bacterium]|nr:hypothetical protein [Gammaproteobacteria bacterium]